MATYAGTEDHDAIAGGTGNDTLLGLAGNDTLDGGLGNDRFIGGLGNDTFVINTTGDTVVEAANEGDADTVLVGLATGAYTLTSNVENATVINGLNLNLTGNTLDNILTGGTGNNQLNGGAGNDTLIGGGGKDTVDGGAGHDVLILSGKQDDYTVARVNATTAVFTGNGEAITVRNVESVEFADQRLAWAGAMANVVSDLGDNLIGTEGADILNGGKGNDTMAGMGGNDTYVVDSVSDVVIEATDGGRDTVRVALATGSYRLSANVEYATITGTGAAGIIGNELDNRLFGNDAANRLEGDVGDDLLDGGLGNDQLIGGVGDDTYIVNATGDTITEAVNAGLDLVQVQFAAAGTYTLSANLEDAAIQTALNGVHLTGNASNNALTGGTGNNQLSGGLGDDLLVGNGGLDTLDGGNGNDTAVLEGARADYTITRIVSGTLSSTVLTHTSDPTDVVTVRGVETFQFTDQTVALADLIASTPSDLADALIGTSGADTIDGYKGNDTMTGLAGDDTYVVDATGDQIIEAEGGGSDLALVAMATGVYTLSAHVEHGTVTGTGAAGIVGNALANRITGNAAANTLTGGAGNDTLDGGLGTDKMAGGTGDDTYVINAAADTVTEIAGEGDDTVLVAFTAMGAYTLAANVEHATITPAASGLAISLTGNASANALAGGAGNNLLVGSAGNDTLIGGSGRDTIDGGADEDTLVLGGAWRDYAVTRAAADMVFTRGAETITVRNVETFQFTDVNLLWEDIVTTTPSDANDRLTGTEYADRLNSGKGNDTLIGLAGDDILDGGAGTDLMVGGAGHDTYTVDALGDQIVENANEGTDTALITLASGSYQLGDQVENGTVTSTGAVGLAGNALNNTLAGNNAANLLTGGEGNDTLNGNEGNDTLDGGLGDDVMAGGNGDDVYRVDSVGDQVMETAYSGTDTVVVALASGTYQLGNEVENAEVAGTGIVHLAGNSLNNMLRGNASANLLTGGAGYDTLYGSEGDDTLDGSGGGDTLIGGAGNDTYYVDNGSDQVVEDTGAGSDTAIFLSSGTFQLGSHVENGRVGPAYDYMNITGNNLDNTLVGGVGSDTLDGGAGNDTMTGGAGNDTYTIDSAGDQIIESANQGYDTVRVSLAGLYQLASDLENAEAIGTAVVQLAGNELNNILTGNSAANLLTGGAGGDQLSGGVGDDTLEGGLGQDNLDGGLGSDLMSGGVGDDNYTVDSWDDVVIEGVGEGADTVFIALTSGSYQLGSHVDNGYVVSTGTVNLVGNELGNRLYGNSVSNLLMGGAGGDTLYGNEGNDTLEGGAGFNFLYGGEGNDTLQGGVDEDYLFGDAGNDILEGGAGTDFLYGGIGLDYFVFNQLDTNDYIDGFETGTDKIRLDTAVFTQLSAGASVDLATNTYLRYNAATGYLQYDADGFGSGNSAFTIVILGTNSGPVNSDIVLF